MYQMTYVNCVLLFRVCESISLYKAKENLHSMIVAKCLLTELSVVVRVGLGVLKDSENVGSPGCPPLNHTEQQGCWIPVVVEQ